MRATGALLAVAGYALFLAAAHAAPAGVTCQLYAGPGGKADGLSPFKHVFVIDEAAHRLRNAKGTELTVLKWSDADILAETSTGSATLAGGATLHEFLTVHLQRFTGEFKMWNSYRDAAGQSVFGERLKALAGASYGGPFGLSDSVQSGECTAAERRF